MDTSERFILYDDRYGYPGNFPLRKCNFCGHGYLANAKFTDEQIEELYSRYYPRRAMSVNDYRPHRELRGFSAWLDGARASAFRWVPRDVRVLDIGCGFGQALGYHVSRGCEAWGVESDENVLRVAQRFGFKVTIGVFDPANFPENYFDVVTLDQVIEHMRDPVHTMVGIRKVLKPEGVVIVSTPNVSGWGARVFGRHWINWHVPYHLNFFSMRSMQIAAERAGLSSLPLGTITHSEWLTYQWIHIATRRASGIASPFWSGTRTYNQVERLILKVASTLQRVRINHLITRVFDSIGKGDSQLFELRKA